MPSYKIAPSSLRINDIPLTFKNIENNYQTIHKIDDEIIHDVACKLYKNIILEKEKKDGSNGIITIEPILTEINLPIENKEKINIQKKFAFDALKKINEIASNAVIAGGALRNWHYNALARDIDIFTSNDISLEQLQIMFPSNEYDVYQWNEADKEKYDSPTGKKPRIKTIIEIQKKINENYHLKMDNTVIQVIILDRVHADNSFFGYSVIGEFDFNICKIFAENDKKIVVSAEAQHDIYKKTLTLDLYNTVERSTIKRSRKRISKLQNLFPNFALKII